MTTVLDMTNSNSIKKPKKGAPEAGPPPVEAAPVDPKNIPKNESKFLSVDTIQIDPSINSRLHLETAGDVFEGLKASIAAVGITTPVEVRDMGGGKFRLLAGFRRMAAAKALGLKEVPVTVLRVEDDVAERVLNLIENVQREDLTTGEIAWACYRIKKTSAEGGKKGLTDNQIADMVGKNRPTITNYIRIFEKTIREVQEGFKAGNVSIETALQCVNMSREDQQEFLDRLKKAKDEPKKRGDAGKEKPKKSKKRDEIMDVYRAMENLIEARVGNSWVEPVEVDGDLMVPVTVLGQALRWAAGDLEKCPLKFADVTEGDESDEGEEE